MSLVNHVLFRFFGQSECGISQLCIVLCWTESVSVICSSSVLESECVIIQSCTVRFC